MMKEVARWLVGLMFVVLIRADVNLKLQDKVLAVMAMSEN